MNRQYMQISLTNFCRILLSLAGYLLFITTVGSQDISSDDLNERMIELSKQLRCLVCQNESLASSNAVLAKELRLEVMKLLEAGQTDEEIKSFLSSRYGDFVLYDPPFNVSTYFLWCAPFLGLVLGVFWLFYLIRQREKSITGRS